jgi:hypothetical protein
VFVFDPLAICLVIAANFAFLRVNNIDTTYPQKESKVKKLTFNNWMKLIKSKKDIIT